MIPFFVGGDMEWQEGFPLDREDIFEIDIQLVAKAVARNLPKLLEIQEDQFTSLVENGKLKNKVSFFTHRSCLMLNISSLL